VIINVTFKIPRKKWLPYIITEITRIFAIHALDVKRAGLRYRCGAMLVCDWLTHISPSLSDWLSVCSKSDLFCI